MCNFEGQCDRMRGWALDQPIVQFRDIEEVRPLHNFIAQGLKG